MRIQTKIWTLMLPVFLLACGSSDDGNDDDDGDSVDIIDQEPGLDDVAFRQEMRDFIIGLSDYSKGMNSAFLIIPQNGIELISNSGEEDGSLNLAYLNAIDGHGQEDLFYGYDEDNVATPSDEASYVQDFLDRSMDSGNTILVTDYCSNPDFMNDSYQKNESFGYISFAADHRELDNIPSFPLAIHNQNSNNVNILADAKNFLYLLNPSNFGSKSDFIEAVSETNYDLLIIDLFFDEGESFNAADLAKLKIKANGGSRLVVAYMSVGEAEDYRYYWQSSWTQSPPSWLDRENPNWEGNYKVKYWTPEWQEVIFGNDASYLNRIIDAGFDGAYLDLVAAFEYYE